MLLGRLSSARSRHHLRRSTHPDLSCRADHRPGRDRHVVVKDIQNKLHRQPRRLPWREVPVQHRAREQAYGRGEIRRWKVSTVQPGLLFPHAVQALEIKSYLTDYKTGKRPSGPSRRSPASQPNRRLAELIRGYWQAEALHHVRDVIFAASRVRIGTTPYAKAILRNLDIGLMRQAG